MVGNGVFERQRVVTCPKGNRQGVGAWATAGILVLLLFGLALAGDAAWAFHENGVANCDGCHISHGTVGGMPVMPGMEWELKAPSASDVCLLCHARGAGAVFGDNPVSPPEERGAGNFVFLLEDNLNDGPNGALDIILGDAAGHNLNAPGHGLVPDRRYVQSPGGTFPVLDMGCTSCHDPHGNTSFRMLNGMGSVQDGVAHFTQPAPEARGIGLSGPGESRVRHSAYLGGVSDWCSNCHGRYHEDGVPSFKHPVDRNLGIEEQTQYNRYDGEDNAVGGSEMTAYLPEVPFEDPALSPGSRGGPTASARLMCLTCHRAHASSAPAAGRWDFNVALLRDDGFESGSYRIPDPYQSQNQRTLCRKCHQAVPEPDTFDPFGAIR